MTAPSQIQVFSGITVLGRPGPMELGRAYAARITLGKKLDEALPAIAPLATPADVPTDESWVERLRAELRACVPEVVTTAGNLSVIERARTFILPQVILAISNTWQNQSRPYLAVVLGQAFAPGYERAKLCEEFHPLVRSGVADCGECFAGEYGFKRPAVAILLSDELAHSQIRWIDASGDRVIVVLPGEYDQL
jgi:hypothetical protein